MMFVGVFSKEMMENDYRSLRLEMTQQDKDLAKILDGHEVVFINQFTSVGYVDIDGEFQMFARKEHCKDFRPLNK